MRKRRIAYSDPAIVEAVNQAHRQQFTAAELYKVAVSHRRDGNYAAYDFWTMVSDYIREEELEP